MSFLFSPQSGMANSSILLLRSKESKIKAKQCFTPPYSHALNYQKAGQASFCNLIAVEYSPLRMARCFDWPTLFKKPLPYAIKLRHNNTLVDN